MFTKLIAKQLFYLIQFVLQIFDGVDGFQLGDRKTQFKEEFWTLIHNQEKSMRTYHDLYSKYKGDKLRSKEFFYLYLTILENTSNFNAWKANLLRVPASEIKSIRTVSALEQKLEEYE